MKPHIHYILEHASWSVGSGKNISFWFDRWLDFSIADHWNIPLKLISSIEVKVADFIVQGNWCLPPYIIQKDPDLAAKILGITLPIEDIPDKLNWVSAADGQLTNKTAYAELYGNNQRVPLFQLLWNTYIPPSRAFITWHLIHNKIPTDENLRKRGCTIVSICCFCLSQAETSQHIFFECVVTTRLWNMLCHGTDHPLNLSNYLSLIRSTSSGGSKMVQHVLNSAVIHTISVIWFERNQRYFHDKHKTMTTLFNCVLAEVRMSYNLDFAKGNNSMHDYKISRLFNIPLKTARATVRQVVHWCPPPIGSVKLNCDGSAVGAHPCGAIGIIPRDSTSTFLGAISSNIGHATALEAEFSAFLRAIETAMDMNMTHIFLETDSIQVVSAYKKNTGFPWKMSARWFNCMKFCESIDCTCMHILREVL